MGICLCPPELVQEGTVCVSRTVYRISFIPVFPSLQLNHQIYGVVPPAPPPIPVAPAAVGWVDCTRTVGASPCSMPIFKAYPAPAPIPSMAPPPCLAPAFAPPPPLPPCM